VKLGSVRIGGPVRIMGILNASPESFYKDSIKRSKRSVGDAVRQMELEGADIVDVGGMSTAPYLDTAVSERVESQRVTGAIKAIQNASNLPISVDTCRASVAKDAMDLGVDILNDISGLKHDQSMVDVLSAYRPSVVLCAFSNGISEGNPVSEVRRFLKESISIARQSGVGPENIAIDPSIGFFRSSARGRFFTKITGDWFERDQAIVRNLKKIKQDLPLLVSVSNKSLIGRLFDVADPLERVSGSVMVEAICVLNGADIIRTHNVAQTRMAASAAARALKTMDLVSSQTKL